MMHAIVAIDTLHEEMPATAWEVFKWTHVTLTILALLINCASLVVIYGLVSKLNPPLRILSSLAFANMLAPWGVATTYFPHTSCQEEIHLTVMLASHNASALTLTALSLAHIVATFRPLRYEDILHPCRIWIAVFFIWAISILGACLHFIVTLIDHDHETLFCSQVYDRMGITIAVTMVIYGISFLCTVLCYTRIFLYLRPLNVLRQSEAEIPRKSTHTVTTGIILTVFHYMVWLPFLVSAFQHLRLNDDNQKQGGFGTIMTMFISLAFILLNCICNPVIYALRMESVTTGYSRMYHKARCWISNGWSKIQSTAEREDQPSDPLNPIESIC